MINKFRRGLTAEEAALIATDLTRHKTIKRAKEYLHSDGIAELFETAEAEIKSNSLKRNHANITIDEVQEHDKNLDNLEIAEQIFEALLDEVGIACEWHDYLSGEVELYIHECITQPRNETPLEVFQICRMAPDDEYSYCPIPTQTTITKVSIAKWFEAHLPDKANLFDPTESYKTTDTGYSMANIREQENLNTVKPIISSQLNFSDQIIQTEAWQDLYKLTEQAVIAFPAWEASQRNPKKIPLEDVKDWLLNTLKYPTRETEIIKRIIKEVFNI